MLDDFRHILGVKFYSGNMHGLLHRTSRGGLVVVPSAPVLVGLSEDLAHREAIESSDVAITDSAFMVLLWMCFKWEFLPRISGLRFMRALLKWPEFREPPATFWVMPTAGDAQANVEWLNSQEVAVGDDDCYVAPDYPSGRLEDSAVLAQIEARRPKFVIINLGGGVQERLGHYLRSRLSYSPAIICTGAAIAFLTGRQVRIPVWADRLMLGWLFRTANNPARFFPRYWKSLRLVPLMWKHGSQSVALKT